MATKSERFELRIDEGVLDRIDKWRSAQEDVPSRAEAVRRLLELGLLRDSAESVSLTDGEKLIALMMRDIYKHLDITDGEIDPDFVADAIWGGHYWALKMQMSGLFHRDRDDPRAFRTVLDVLDMWTFIEAGYEKLPKKERAKIEADWGGNVHFDGFDGNNETVYMGIADFLVNKMGRFSRFKGRDLNSHMPTLQRYQWMLAVFGPIRKTLVGRDLTTAEIVTVLQAQ